MGANLKTEGKIGIKEQVSILMISMGIKLTDGTSTLFYPDVKSATWMVPILAFSIFIPFFWMVSKVMEFYKDKGLIEVNYKIFGRSIGFVFNIALFVIGFSIWVMDIRGYMDLLRSIFFTETPLYFITFIFLLGCLFASLRGWETIGSTFYICLPYIKLALLILGILMLKESEWKRVFPLFGAGGVAILSEAFKKASMFGDLFFLLVLYPKLHKNEKFKKIGTIFAGIVAVEIALYYFLYVAMIGFPLVEKITYPFHESAKYVEIGYFATHIETYFLFFWLMAALLRFSFYMYATSVLLGDTLKIKDTNKTLLPLTAMVIALVQIIENPAINEFHLRDNRYTFSTIFLMLYSLVLYSVFLIKKKRKKI